MNNQSIAQHTERHTAGRWTVGKPAWLRGAWRSVTAGTNGTVAYVRGPANAQLVAASPRCLAALKNLLGAVTAHPAFRAREYDALRIEAIRAIADAEVL